MPLSADHRSDDVLKDLAGRPYHLILICLLLIVLNNLLVNLFVECSLLHILQGLLCFRLEKLTDIYDAIEWCEQFVRKRVCQPPLVTCFRLQILLLHDVVDVSDEH